MYRRNKRLTCLIDIMGMGVSLSDGREVAVTCSNLADDQVDWLQVVFRTRIYLYVSHEM